MLWFLHACLAVVFWWWLCARWSSSCCSGWVVGFLELMVIMYSHMRSWDTECRAVLQQSDVCKLFDGLASEFYWFLLVWIYDRTEIVIIMLSYMWMLVRWISHLSFLGKPRGEINCTVCPILLCLTILESLKVCKVVWRFAKSKTGRKIYNIIQRYKSLLLATDCNSSM